MDTKLGTGANITTMNASRILVRVVTRKPVNLKAWPSAHGDLVVLYPNTWYLVALVQRSTQVGCRSLYAKELVRIMLATIPAVVPLVVLVLTGSQPP
jgi:hypothetical protein